MEADRLLCSRGVCAIPVDLKFKRNCEVGEMSREVGEAKLRSVGAPHDVGSERPDCR